MHTISTAIFGPTWADRQTGQKHHCTIPPATHTSPHSRRIPTINPYAFDQDIQDLQAEMNEGPDLIYEVHDKACQYINILEDDPEQIWQVDDRQGYHAHNDTDDGPSEDRRMVLSAQKAGTTKTLDYGIRCLHGLALFDSSLGRNYTS